jgi:hypothetical protein
MQKRVPHAPGQNDPGRFFNLPGMIITAHAQPDDRDIAVNIRARCNAFAG